ncbi:MAG TPA: hypothetical protein VG796_01260 [Verrucomicrobiales bacterium]|nr:hypothetical protein [Verrucomicrobiales bacterium]
MPSSAPSKPVLCLFDVLTGRQAVVEATPYIVGSGQGCDWRIEDPDIPEEWFELQKKGADYFVAAGKSMGQIRFNDDAACTLAPIELKQDHTLNLGRQFLVLRKTKYPWDWLSRLYHQKWYIYDEANSGLVGPFAPGSLTGEISKRGTGANTLLLCGGMTSRGFFAKQLLPVLEPGAELPTAKADPHSNTGPVNSSNGGPAPSAEPIIIDTEYGEFTCPVCWLKFDRGDIMNIAAHASLRGDPLLGDFEMQRFQATRFNDRGIALDPMNIPAPDQACPHCRRKLPPGFLDRPHYIFSIVGAPSSGKSYYLSVLARTLQSALFKHFGIVFRDADPSGNAILNQMISRLFSQATPEDAYIAKTDLEGDLYETLPRYGQKVKLPKPFIFKLSNPREPSADFSIVLYDNAGEHFQPGRNNTDSPGAQHIAVASGIFFLFDPLHSPDFLRRLGSVDDPQAAERRDEQQDVLLAETEVRIKSILGMDSGQRISTPLAVLVGKCDTWQHLLGEIPLEPAVRDEKLDLPALRRNSARIRALLCDVSPAIVANSEAISSEVMFFAVSPLGCSPVIFTDAAGGRKLGPDPGRIAPIAVDVPTLWVLSQIAPAMVPVHS